MPRPQLSDALAFAAIEAVRAHDGNMSEAARTLGLSRTTRHTPNSELCNLVTMTDCHVGALAWAREADEDWDLSIARETLTQSFIGMIYALPPAGTLVLSQLVDFLHTDGLTPVTPAHGHILDADSRFQKMAEAAVDILEDIIAAALERNDRVHVIMAEGNHDESSSVWLRVMFKRLFRNEPRVSVEDSPLPYYVCHAGLPPRAQAEAGCAARLVRRQALGHVGRHHGALRPQRAPAPPSREGRDGDALDAAPHARGQRCLFGARRLAIAP